MIKFPDNALDPTSKAWSRKVEDEIRDLRTALNVDGSFSRNSAAGLNGTLRKISEQIAAIEETQAQIQTVVSGLEAQQAELAAQQAELSAQVARIDSLVNNQTVTRVGQATAGYPAFTVPTGWGDYAIVDIPVPAGYTQATVMAVCTVGFSSNPADAAQFLVRVNGDDGPLGTVGLTTGTFDAAAASHARVISGLSGGSVTVSFRMRSGAGIISAGALSTVVNVTFHR